MLENNQFGFTPGVYVHYEFGHLYVVRTLITHRRASQGLWIPLPDPLVAYEHLEPLYAPNPVNPETNTMVQKGFMMRLSEFRGEVKTEQGIVKRFVRV